MIEQTNYDYITIINIQDNSLDLEFDSDDFQSLVKCLSRRTNCIRLEEIWHSRQNNYLAYDYKPFNSMGFKYIASLYYKDIEQVKFADFVLDKEIQKRKELDKLLLLEAN